MLKKAALVMVLSIAMYAHGQSQPGNGNEAMSSGKGGALIKDTRVFSCGDAKGSYRKCRDGELPWPVSGVLTIRASGGVCEQHTYGVGVGPVYQSKDGTQQIQLPVSADRLENFRCDEHGNAI